MDEKTVARFWGKVDKSDGCWLWSASKDRHGYGKFWHAPRLWSAHRLSWMFAHGDPGIMCVLHRCDTPACVNPAHLFLGTQQENLRDMTRKGRRRSGGVHGVQSPNAKLTEDKVREIRARYRPGDGYALAREFGVAHNLIWLIVRRRAWKHVA